MEHKDEDKDLTSIGKHWLPLQDHPFLFLQMFSGDIPSLSPCGTFLQKLSFYPQ